MDIGDLGVAQDPTQPPDIHPDLAVGWMCLQDTGWKISCSEWSDKPSLPGIRAPIGWMIHPPFTRSEYLSTFLCRARDPVHAKESTGLHDISGTYRLPDLKPE